MSAPKKSTGKKNTSQKVVENQKTVEKKQKLTNAETGKNTKTASKATPVKKAAPVKSESKNEKSIRSFKVRLPEAEEYIGRFTGLTPYQAANKALSKYYRETENAKKDIQFSIRESTRGSKRSTYTYKGARLKLKDPVKYTITANNEEREIIKNFKNKLTKVKKADLVNSN